MRVLIVSYYFPPAAGGGVQRVLKWCQYLHEIGIEPHVLTPDDPRWIDTGGGLEVPYGTVVHRSHNLSPRSVRPREEIEAARGRMGRLARRALLQPRRVLVPDMHIGWALSAVRAGTAAVRMHDIDIVVSTSPPETDHVIAARIARRCSVPWVADFRDSWLDLPHLRTDRSSVRAKHAANVRIATRIMPRAAAITTVSQPLADDLSQRHPGSRIEVIPNGVDLADLASLPAPLPLQSGADRASRFVISYTGNFFGRQSPATFLSALTQVLERRSDIASALTMRFVGGLKAQDEATISATPVLAAATERIGFMEYRDVLAEQHAADLLLLYVAPGAGSQGVYTGKVFEYVGAQRPILALVPEDNVCVPLVTDAGTGIVVNPDDIDAIATAIEQAYDTWRVDGRRSCVVPEAVLHRISRRAGTEQLAGLLSSVTGIS